MSPRDILDAEKRHLAQLLEAVQRCVFFLDGVAGRLDWPLSGGGLEACKKDAALFDALAAFNERFAKLQDTLAAGMRHAHLLHGESAENFLKVLAFFEKQGVVASLDDWQLLRAARNLAAHDYETDYAAIAEHFNTLHQLLPGLLMTSAAFVRSCGQQLGVEPASTDFSAEFLQITAGLQ
ncbi:hypothetical protein [Azonexus sp.]|uniref:hypothetical protein n=1 Tax=Azonexus sp. TaxID=1872668 RepID=UPI0035ADC768